MHLGLSIQSLDRKRRLTAQQLIQMQEQVCGSGAKVHHCSNKSNLIKISLKMGQSIQSPVLHIQMWDSITAELLMPQGTP